MGSDESIVEACLSKMRAGRDFRNEYSELVRRYTRVIFAVVLSRVRDYHRAEEIVQEVFIKAYRKLGHFSARGSFLSWLCTIAVNSSKDYLGKEKMRSIPFDERILNTSDAPPNLYSVNSQAEANEIGRDILGAILSLPERVRESAIMRFIHDSSYAEIAQRLGLSEGTIKSRLFRARKILHKQLRPLMDQLKGIEGD